MGKVIMHLHFDITEEDIIDIMERTKPEHSWDAMMGVAVLIDSNEPTNPVRVFLDKEDGAFWVVAEDNTNQYFAHKIQAFRSQSARR